MRKFIALLILVFALFIAMGPVLAQETTDVNLKQGVVMIWKDSLVKNVSLYQLANTAPVDSWPKWANAIVDGWVVDVGPGYDANEIKDGVLLLGREVGTIAKYFPVKFPYLDKIRITVYPVGLYAKGVFDNPKFKGCSGGSYVKLTLQF